MGYATAPLCVFCGGLHNRRLDPCAVPQSTVGGELVYVHSWCRARYQREIEFIEDTGGSRTIMPNAAGLTLAGAAPLVSQ